MEVMKKLPHDAIPECSKCGYTVKPKITFFGEKIASKVGRSLQSDREKADCILVMGTSLKVSPMDRMLSYFPPKIPQILINKTHVQPRANISDGFDAELLGNADDVVDALLATKKDAKQCSWENDEPGIFHLR